MTRNLKLTTNKSDGSDGYEPGTWDWRVFDANTGNMWFDGGWPDERSAREHGECTLKRLLVD